jgi:hypothetical protein
MVKEVLEDHIETVNSKSFKHPVELKFQKLKIRCLSLDNRPEAIVWLSSNYFNGENKLSKEEEIAFRVYVNQKIAEYLKKHPFEDSEEYRKLQQDNKFLDHHKKIFEWKKALDNGEKVKTKLEKEKRKANKIEKTYRREYREFVQRKIYAEDPFLNSILAKYGWCITVHKAVGSRFENICINGSQGENRGYTNEAYFRWLYSAATISHSKIYLLNPVEIDPLMDCRFVDIDEVGWSNKNQKELEFPNYTIPRSLDEKIEDEINHNVKSAISIFSSHLGHSGILLEKTAFNNQYLAKAFYSIPDDDKKQLVIAFNSNAKSKVTSIRTERNGEILNGEFEKGLEKLREVSGDDSQSKSKNIPQDFRFEIYYKWIEQSKTKGGNLFLIESHEYDDVFIYNRDNEKVEFKAYFNDRGFISVITVLRKSNEELSQELENILLNGR